MKLQVPVIIGKVQTMVDGGVRATHDYPDLPPAQKTVLFQLTGLAVNQIIATDEEAISDKEIVEKKPDLKPKKTTKSQILRLAIEDLWERRGAKGDSEDFYNQTMDKLIEKIREQDQ